MILSFILQRQSLLMMIGKKERSLAFKVMLTVVLSWEKRLALRDFEVKGMMPKESEGRA